MTITNSSTKLVAIATSVAVGIALMSAVAIAPAQAAALSQTQIQAIISLLSSFGADASTIANVTASLNGQATTGTGTGTSTGGACPVLTRSLQQGSNGSDVQSLQVFLNANAATRVAVTGAGSPGMESTYFGPATHAAVVKFQAANGVSAIGVVGPATRAAIAAVCGTTGGNTGGNTGGSTVLQGGEGELLINDTLGDVEDEVDEGDNGVQVFGAELEANDSDVMVERVDVDIEVGSGGSSRLNNYIDSVSLMLDGKKLASMDVDEGDEDDDVYSFRFTGLKGVIKEDDTAELYVTVDAVNNVDSQDSSVDLTVSIPDNGIRAVDAAGISETYVSSDELAAGNAETFSVVEATSGDLDLSEGDDNPDTGVVQIDEDDETNGVLLLAFDLEAKNQDVNVDAIPVSLTTGGGTGDEVDGVARRVILKKDGTTLDTVSIGASATTSIWAVFDNLDLDIDEGDTANFEVYVDLNDADVATFATGTTLTASTTASNVGWDTEDANGDDVSIDGGTVTGGTLTFETEGITADVVSKSANTTSVDSTDNDYATFTMAIDVTAFDEDIYIPATGASALSYVIENASTGNTLASSTATTTTVSSTADLDNAGDSYHINAGQTERFTFTVTLDPKAEYEGQQYRLQAQSIVFGDSANADNTDSLTLAPASDYETTGTLIAD